MIAIGPASADEREWAARLMAASDPWRTLGRGVDACRSACLRPELEMFVAREDGAPIGFTLLHPRGVAGSPYLAAIAVAEGQRGKSVGARLLAHAEERFRPAARHFFLCVSSFNEAARRFYERHDYREVGVLEDYIVDGASESLMHKWLRR